VRTGMKSRLGLRRNVVEELQLRTSEVFREGGGHDLNSYDGRIRNSAIQAAFRDFERL